MAHMSGMPLMPPFMPGMLPPFFYPPLPDPFDDRMNAIRSIVGKQAMPTKRREPPTAVVDEASRTPLASFHTIAAVLRFRAHATPNKVALTVVDGKGRETSSISYQNLSSRAEKVAQTIKDRSHLQKGENIALLYRRSEIIDCVAALFGCFYAGMVAVPIVTSSTNVDDELTEIMFIIENCRIGLALSTDLQIKALAKEFGTSRGASLPKIEWWKTNEFGLYHPKKKGVEEIVNVNVAENAYVEYSKNAIGELKGIVIDHRTVMNQCYVFKGANGTGSADVVLSYLEPRQQSGLSVGILGSIYNGSHAIVMSEQALTIPGMWMQLVTKYKGTIALADYPGMIDVISSGAHHITNAKTPLVDLSSLHTVVIDSVTPDGSLTRDIATILTQHNANPKLRVLPVVCLNEFGGFPLSLRDAAAGEGTRKEGDGESGTGSDIGPGAGALDIYVDQAALREGNVRIMGYSGDGKSDLTKDVAGWKRLTEIGFIVPDVSIAIVDPETKALLPPNTVGEIWVHAPNLLPRVFWALPKLSEQKLHAHPILYTSSEVPSRPPSSSSESIDTGRPQSTVSLMSLRADPLELQDFVRTGLFGFLVDDNAIPELQLPRLFVVGIKRDRLWQRKLLSSSVPETGKAGRRLSAAYPANGINFYFMNELVDTVMLSIEGIECCAIFTVCVNGDNLPVVLFEPAAKMDLPAAAARTMQILADVHGLRAYCVSICQVGSLPRMRPDPTTGTQMQTSFYGYTSGVVTVPAAAAGEALTVATVGHSAVVKRKLVPLDTELCKSAFLEGDLRPIHLTMNVESDVITTVAKFNAAIEGDPDNPIVLTGSDGTTHKVGQVVGGMAEIPILDDKTGKDLNEFPTLMHLLIWRAETFADEPAYVPLDARGRESKPVSFKKLSSKVHSLAHYLLQKRNHRPGDHVLLVFTHGVEYAYALQACLYAGLIPIPLAPPDLARLKEDVPAMLQLIDDFKIKEILANPAVEESLKSKQIVALIKAVRQKQGVTAEKDLKGLFPTVFNVTKATKLGKQMSTDDSAFYWASAGSTAADGTSKRRAASSATAVVLVTFSADMKRTCVRLSHRNLLDQCRVQVAQSQMVHSCIPGYSGGTHGRVPSYRPLVSCVRSYNGLGFLYSMVLGLYVGSVTYIIPPFDYFINPLVWFDTLHKHKVKDAFTTYAMLEHSMRVMQNVDYRSFSLHNLRNMMIATEGRTKPEVYKTMHQNFLANRLEDAAIATVYSPDINPMVSSRGYMSTEVTSLWLDLQALRRGNVHVVKEMRGESGKMKEVVKDANGEDVACVMLQDSGKIPNNTIVAIVHPRTRRLCSPYEVGEIWVCSPGNVQGYYGPTLPDGTPSTDELERPLFHSTIEGLDPSLAFARTGDRGFLWPVPADGTDLDSRSGRPSSVRSG
ncbi:hypothetical protein HK104_010827, partial [Borealophlyctis nickersoniae]